MKGNKYEILKDRCIALNGQVRVYRIKALRSFGDVKKGDLGGYIEKEENLSQTGDCWLYEGSVVIGNSVVSGDARIVDSTILSDTIIRDKVFISRSKIANSIITGKTSIINDEVIDYSEDKLEIIKKLAKRIRKLSQEDFNYLMSLIFNEEEV